MKKLMVIFAMLMALVPTAFGASSELNRDDRLIFVGLPPLGISVPALLSLPFSLGVYVGDDMLFAGEAGRKTYKYENMGQSVEGSYTNLGGYMRWFPGNSFNVYAGMHHRTVEVEGKINFEAGGIKSNEYIVAKLQTITGSLGIGNQWIMDFGLTIGIDWLVGTAVIDQAESFSDSKGAYTLLTPEEKKAVEEEMALINKVLGGYPGGLFLLQFGWAF
ncbi:MAG: hypothetical protein OEZ59_09355 [Deltaproteobacteria bacterium]|nr:hypothetical protein [Deltaproteobacteria bacterium]